MSELEKPNRLYFIGAAYSMKGNYSGALDYLFSSMILMKKIYKIENTKMAKMYTYIGSTYYKIKRYLFAKKYYKKTLKIFLREYGKKDKHTLRTYRNLSVIYKKIGDMPNYKRYKKLYDYYRKK